MPTQIPGSAVTVIDMNLALFGTTPSNTVFMNQLAGVGLNNANLEGGPAYATAAVAFNQAVTNGYNNSSNPDYTVIPIKGGPGGISFVGQVFVLSTGTDAIVGTVASEIFISTETTLNAGDVLAGGGGNDTLLFSTTGAAPVSKTGFTTNGIQTVHVTSDAIGGTSLDTSGMVGMATLINDNSSTNVNFNQVANLMSFTALNVSGGDTTINYAAGAVSGKADLMNLMLNNNKSFSGGSIGFIQADGIESFNITTTGDASSIADIKSNTLQSVVIQGTANLTLHSLSFANPGGTHVVEASLLTGKLDLTLGINTTGTSVRGGHNTDTLHFGGNRADYLVTIGLPADTPVAMVHDQRITLLPIGDVTATYVERLAFHNQGLALDMNIGQAGGKAVVLLAEALGAAYLQDKSFVAKALAYFDSGASLQDGANLLLASGTVAALAGGSGNAALVGFVYHNVFGIAPDAATLALLQAPLDNHSLTQAQWLAAVAQIGVVQDQVHLTGYAQTGLGYAL